MQLMEELCFEVSEEGERVDKYLAIQLPDKTRSFIQKLIKEGHVTVKDIPVKANYKPRIGDKLYVEIPP